MVPIVKRNKMEIEKTKVKTCQRVEDLADILYIFQIELKFNEKFYGIAYADFDRHSACQVAGKGATSYKLELPLKGCGTKQVHTHNGLLQYSYSTRNTTFTNFIIFRMQC